MIPVLVTGGAGYIGSHTCKALAAAGYLPVSYDNLSRGHAWAVRWGPLEIGDINDRARLEAVIRQHRPVAVLHFAAYAYVGESVADPRIYYRNNVGGSLTLLETMLDHGVVNFVFSSSCATYGLPPGTPITEDMPQNPINPYGMSKLSVERLCRDFAVYGLRTAILRYFNAAGADPGGETGEMHNPETHLIPLTLQAAAGQQPSITVHGNDYDTPDGTCIRDYIHVSDLADAHVLALQTILNGGEAVLALNLGNGHGFSVLDVIGAARRITGSDFAVRYGPRRAGDPPVLVADARQATKRLGWRPRYTSLTQIIGTAWEWMKRSSSLPVPTTPARLDSRNR